MNINNNITTTTNTTTSNKQLLVKFNSSVSAILNRLNDTISLAHNGATEPGLLAVEALQIQHNTSIIVKMATELLNLTKNLKEMWILGQPNASFEDALSNEEINSKLYLRIENILNNLTSLGIDTPVVKPDDVEMSV
ncbi:hypothetical protein DAMA08_040490 [Martiniozyma asiatica (nom. inval.)]|nr:hypothetical protein DAMA08_040490 [Martiniozyma asiatica]